MATAHHISENEIIAAVPKRHHHMINQDMVVQAAKDGITRDVTFSMQRLQSLTSDEKFLYFQGQSKEKQF